MKENINLYLSAASDLIPERDLISRAVTEIPVTLGWKINYSPLGSKSLDKSLLREADIHILILGEDIRAPIGYEWYLSLNYDRKPIFFLKADIPRTMAGGEFKRLIAGYPRILTYKTLAEFKQLAIQQIGKHLLEHADHFSILSTEYQEIAAFIDQLEQDEPESIDQVTGEDSVILTREHFTPKGGVLIERPGEDRDRPLDRNPQN